MVISHIVAVRIQLDNACGLLPLAGYLHPVSAHLVVDLIRTGLEKSRLVSLNFRTRKALRDTPNQPAHFVEKVTETSVGRAFPKLI